MIRDMQSPEGGYWSALDADSEGHEGKFYVWQPEEVSRLLDAEDYAVFARHFGLDRAANFEGQDWHLHVFRSEEDIGAELGIEPAEVTKRLEHARRALLEVRNRRVWPGRDEKVLTSWNGLAIGGLAVAARALRRPDLADAAARAVDFIRQHCWRDGRLLATYKDGRARFAAYLDDYAFLLDGVLELMQTRWRSEDLKFATELAEALLAHFEDRESGGFFFTADDHEQLMHRSRSFSDEAAARGQCHRGPGAHATWACCWEKRDIWTQRRRHCVPPGPPCSTILMRTRPCSLLWKSIWSRPRSSSCAAIAKKPRAGATSWRRSTRRDDWCSLSQPTRSDLPAAIADKKPLPETAAYVCRGMTCSAPVKSLSSLIALTRTVSGLNRRTARNRVSERTPIEGFRLAVRRLRASVFSFCALLRLLHVAGALDAGHLLGARRLDRGVERALAPDLQLLGVVDDVLAALRDDRW